MIDATQYPQAAHDAAVCVETLWNDLPNPALAHLGTFRHELLLGADIVVDFYACETERRASRAENMQADPACSVLSNRGPAIVDWDAPRPRACTSPSRELHDAEGERELLLDMSLLCPRALFVRVNPEDNVYKACSEAVVEALERAHRAEKNR